MVNLNKQISNCILEQLCKKGFDIYTEKGVSRQGFFELSGIMSGGCKNQMKCVFINENNNTVSDL